MIYSLLNNKSAWLISILLITVASSPGAEPLTISDLPDPTRLLKTSTSSANNNTNQTLRLQSILYSGERKSIIINGAIKYIGSSINGRRIIDIQPHSVVINHHGQLQTLRLNTSNSVTRRGDQ